MKKSRLKNQFLKYSKNFSKYLLDLLIVAFGVFLALYVGERNNQRKADQNTLNALTQIISELESNAKNIENTIAYHKKVSVELDSLISSLSESDQFVPYLENYEKLRFHRMPSWRGYEIAETDATFYESAQISGIFSELNIETIQIIASIYKFQKQYTDVGNLSMNKLLDMDSNTQIVDIIVLLERLVKDDIFGLENAMLAEVNGSIEKLKQIRANKSYKK